MVSLSMDVLRRESTFLGLVAGWGGDLRRLQALLELGVGVGRYIACGA